MQYRVRIRTSSHAPQGLSFCQVRKCLQPGHATMPCTGLEANVHRIVSSSFIDTFASAPIVWLQRQITTEYATPNPQSRGGGPSKWGEFLAGHTLVRKGLPFGPNPSTNLAGVVKGLPVGAGPLFLSNRAVPAPPFGLYRPVAPTGWVHPICQLLPACCRDKGDRHARSRLLLLRSGPGAHSSRTDVGTIPAQAGGRTREILVSPLSYGRSIACCANGD